MVILCILSHESCALVWFYVLMILSSLVQEREKILCVAHVSMVPMHVSYESDVLYIYAFPILVVVSYMLLQYSMCGSYVFFVSSFWLKLGSDIKCQPDFSL